MFYSAFLEHTMVIIKVHKTRGHNNSLCKATVIYISLYVMTAKWTRLEIVSLRLRIRYGNTFCSYQKISNPYTIQSMSYITSRVSGPKFEFCMEIIDFSWNVMKTTRNWVESNAGCMLDAYNQNTNHTRHSKLLSKDDEQCYFLFYFIFNSNRTFSKRPN